MPPLVVSHNCRPALTDGPEVALALSAADILIHFVIFKSSLVRLLLSNETPI